MSAFRVLLGIFIIGIFVFTGIVISNHGWNLLPIFFGDMTAMTWPGQFNFDFLCFLILSGLWLAWRHRFSPGGIILGVLGLFGGIMVLAPYLLIASYKANGDIKHYFSGKGGHRAPRVSIAKMVERRLSNRLPPFLKEMPAFFYNH